MSLNDREKTGPSSLTKGVFIVVGLICLAGSAALAVWLIKTGPKPHKRTPRRMVPMVETITMEAERRRVVIPAMGTIKPAVSINLKAQVSGEIIRVHPLFTAGGIIKKGETVLKIDPRDYELALATKTAELESARAEYSLEQGRQEIARQEWKILGQDQTASPLDRDLALRQPHLKQKQAVLKAASIAVEKARLNLERTEIKAPFNGIVRSTSVHVGDQATPSTSLAVLIGYDYYYLQLSVPVDSLKWIVFPGSRSAGALVDVFSSPEKKFSGRVVQLLSDLEERGRTARVQVKIDDPLGIGKHGKKTGDSLLLGEFVHGTVMGKYVDQVFKIPPESVHDGKIVWLMDEKDRLAVKEIHVLWRDRHALYTRTLRNGDRLIVSDLPAPVIGMTLRSSRKQRFDGLSDGKTGKKIKRAKTDG